MDSEDGNRHRRKSKKIAPSPINLNELYVNGARRSINKRVSRKSSINL